MKILKSLSIAVLLAICLIGFGKTNVQAEMMAYDADGQYLGILLGTTHGVADIYIPSLDRNVTIHFGSGDAEETYILFESSDCSGMPYFYSSASYLILKNGGKYYTGQKIAPRSVQINSLLWQDGLCTQDNRNISGLVPAEEVTTPFTVPVALPLSFELENPHPGQWKK